MQQVSTFAQKPKMFVNMVGSTGKQISYRFATYNSFTTALAQMWPWISYCCKTTKESWLLWLIKSMQNKIMKHFFTNEESLRGMQMQRYYQKNNRENLSNLYQNQRSKSTDSFYAVYIACVSNVVKFENWLIIHWTVQIINNLVFGNFIIDQMFPNCTNCDAQPILFW